MKEEGGLRQHVSSEGGRGPLAVGERGEGGGLTRSGLKTVQQQLRGQRAPGCGAVFSQGEDGRTTVRAMKAGGITELWMVISVLTLLLLTRLQISSVRMPRRSSSPAGQPNPTTWPSRWVLARLSVEGRTLHPHVVGPPLSHPSLLRLTSATLFPHAGCGKLLQGQEEAHHHDADGAQVCAGLMQVCMGGGGEGEGRRRGQGQPLMPFHLYHFVKPTDSSVSAILVWEGRNPSS